MLPYKVGDKIIVYRKCEELPSVDSRYERLKDLVLTYNGSDTSQLPGGRWIYFQEEEHKRHPVKETMVTFACSLARVLWETKSAKGV